MNYTTLGRLNTILMNLQKDAVVIGFTIAGLMVTITAIILMFDQDTSPTAQNRRWEGLRRVLISAAIIAAAGALISFSRQLGGSLN